MTTKDKQKQQKEEEKIQEQPCCANLDCQSYKIYLLLIENKLKKWVLRCVCEKCGAFFYIYLDKDISLNLNFEPVQANKK